MAATVPQARALPYGVFACFLPAARTPSPAWTAGSEKTPWLWGKMRLPSAGDAWVSNDRAQFSYSGPR